MLLHVTHPYGAAGMILQRSDLNRDLLRAALAPGFLAGHEAISNNRIPGNGASTRASLTGDTPETRRRHTVDTP